MPNLSPHLFDNALNFLYPLTTPRHYKYLVANIKDGLARFVIDKLLNDGLITKDYKDYYQITTYGREVVDGGGYGNYYNSNKPNGVFAELADMGMGTSLARALKHNSEAESKKRYAELSHKIANPKVSRKRKLLNFLAHQDTKTIVQYFVWFIAIITSSVTFFKWVLPYLKEFN